MIQVLLVITKEGELVSCKAEGHALFSKKGSDIVCAAVTTLLRTTLSVLESYDFITLEASAPVRGTLSFHIKKKHEDGKGCKASDSSLLIYAKDFLEKGITTLCNEYPEHVSLHITNNKNVGL